MSIDQEYGDAIRTRGGKWHRGGRYDYPGERHCPTGLGLVLMPRGTEREWADGLDPDDCCRRCYPPLSTLSERK